MDPIVEPFPGAAHYPAAERLGDLVATWLDRDPDAPWLTRAGHPTWARRDLVAAAAAVQAGLRRRGVRPGSSVALMCENSLEMAAALVAVPSMGAVAVPINVGLVSNGLRHVLEHSGAEVLIADTELARRCLEVAPALRPDQVVTVGQGELPGCAGWADAFPAGSAEFVSVGGADDPALNIYTSGTTGTAKGVLLSHRTVLLGSYGCAGVMFEATDKDVIYTALPFFHCAALQLGLWTSLVSGAHLVFEAHFSASRFWSTVREYGVSAFHFIGPLMSILWLAPPSPQDREHPVRLAVGGGPRAVWTEFEERFGVDIVETYGMTETFGGCVAHRPGRGKPWTVGRPMDHVEVAVVDEGGQPLPPGERGEVWIRGRVPGALMSGYHKEPDRTAEAMRGGWYHTGDLGSFDEEGFLRFHSRLRDIIRHRGENVSAVEIESVVTGHDQVLECAAVAVPSEIYEEDILLVVVPAGGDPDPLAIVQHAAERLPTFAVPRYVAVVAELPKTATARVQKHLLQDLRHQAWDRLAQGEA